MICWNFRCLCRPGARIAWLKGGGRNKFWGGTRSLLMWIREGHGGTRNLFQCGSTEKCEDQKKVFNSKMSTNSGCRLKMLAIFHEFLSEDQKKRSSSKKFCESRCESTKIRKIRAVNTNLGVSGLDLHSKNPKPVNFFAAQSSLGEGAQFSFGGHNHSFGGHGPGMLPVAPGLCLWVILGHVKLWQLAILCTSMKARIKRFELLK